MNTDEICELLIKQFPNISIAKNESMKKHTSFRIGGEAEIFIKAKSIEEIKYIQ